MSSNAVDRPNLQTVKVIAVLLCGHDIQLVKVPVAIEVPFVPSGRLAGSIRPGREHRHNVQLVKPTVAIGITWLHVDDRPSVAFAVRVRDRAG